MLEAPHSKIVCELLFELATWHALAKLRLHTETTVTSLEHSTTRLGVAIRKFKKETCSAFTTFDLPSEDAARARRQAKNVAKGKTADGKPLKRKPRTFNMVTYKLHALGHYAEAIWRFGPSDGFSTQTVRVISRKFSLTGDDTSFQGEAEHQKVKRYYKWASKCDYTRGIAKQNHREREFRKINEREMLRDALDSAPSLSPRNKDALPAIAPDIHHYMSHEMKNKINLSKWLRKNKNDPACKVGFRKNIIFMCVTWYMHRTLSRSSKIFS